jgi:threonine dehydrogenase-like Zn-dependent dehydrogenase
MKHGVDCMKAIIFKGPGKFAIEDRPKPVINSPDDVLLKVLGVGICGTDLHILMDPPLHPAIPNIIFGHEFCGEVSEIGANVNGIKKGDKVIVDPHPPCGKCKNCISDRPLMCSELYGTVGREFPEFMGHAYTRGIFQDGALTSYVCVPANSVFKIKKETPIELAALAEPLSCTSCALAKLKIQPGDTVCVLGGGPIGLLFTCLAKASGATTLIVSEPAEYRRRKALKCGATRVVDPSREDLKAVILEETHGLGVDHCVEAVGAELMTAISVVRCNGKVLQFGHDETAEPPIRLGDIVRKEVEIYGGFLGKYYFEKTARIIESGILPLGEIVTHTYPLSKYQEAIDLLRRREGLKVVIYPED